MQPEITRHGEGDYRVGANADFGPFFQRRGVYSKYQIFLPDGLINNASPSPSRSIYSVFCGLAAAISVLVRDFNILGMFLHLVFLAFWQRGAKQDT
ncbi:hypothetical protein LPA67_00050 [Salmonella enterica subsp. enterica]